MKLKVDLERVSGGANGEAVLALDEIKLIYLNALVKEHQSDESQIKKSI